MENKVSTTLLIVFLFPLFLVAAALVFFVPLLLTALPVILVIVAHIVFDLKEPSWTIILIGAYFQIGAILAATVIIVDSQKDNKNLGYGK